MNAPFTAKQLNTLTNDEIAAGNTTAEQIWSAAYERIVATVKGFTTYRRTPLLTLQPADMPCLAVYLLRDREQPIGDYNVGEPRFMQSCHLGIAGMILASNVDLQLEMLASKVMATRLSLFTDPQFIRLICGFESVDTRLVFSRINDTPVAEYQMELVVSFETIWPPHVPDDFLRLHLTTAFPTPDKMGETQQVRVDLEFDADGNLIKPPPMRLPNWHSSTRD